MAIDIIETTLRPQDGYVDAVSRYVGGSIIYWGRQRRLTFKTYKKKTYTPDPADKFTVVPAGMEYRPDLVATKAYGTPDVWWRVMEVNGIKDVFDFKAGLTLRLPANI